MSKGSIILFILLVVLPLSIYIYKSGFTIPTLDWFQVMTNLTPSSILFFVCLLFVNRRMTTEKENLESRISNIQFGFNKLIQIDAQIDESKNLVNSLNQEKNKAIKDMDDAKQKMMIDIDKRLKENNDILIERIDKRMDVIDSNLNNKLDTTIANSKLNEIISKMNENNENLKIILDFNDNVIANKLNETENLWKDSMTTLLQSMELSKKARIELAEELNGLRMKLSRSRGEEYKQTLEKYNKLKAKLKEMNE